GNDPILQQIALRIGLNVDRHVLVMGRLATLGLEIVVLSTVRTGKYSGPRGSGFDGRRLLFSGSAGLCTHDDLPVATFVATNFSTPSSHRRRKLVEIDVFGLHSIDLQDGQHSVDHRRRAAGVGVNGTS